jgi:hypothetical protein
VRARRERSRRGKRGSARFYRLCWARVAFGTESTLGREGARRHTAGGKKVAESINAGTEPQGGLADEQRGRMGGGESGSVAGSDCTGFPLQLPLSQPPSLHFIATRRESLADPLNPYDPVLLR